MSERSHTKKLMSFLKLFKMLIYIEIEYIHMASYHIAVQSKCTISHFDGLNAIESAFSMPFSQTRYSGQMNALPAYAASTCSQILCSLQISPIYAMKIETVLFYGSFFFLTCTKIILKILLVFMKFSTFHPNVSFFNFVKQ